MRDGRVLDCFVVSSGFGVFVVVPLCSLVPPEQALPRLAPQRPRTHRFYTHEESRDFFIIADKLKPKINNHHVTFSVACAKRNSGNKSGDKPP